MTGSIFTAPRDQLRLFEECIDVAINGAVAEGLKPGDQANSDALILALTNKLGEVIERERSRDGRAVIVTQVWKRLRQITGVKV